jgi:hypothetical protein
MSSNDDDALLRAAFPNAAPATKDEAPITDTNALLTGAFPTESGTQAPPSNSSFQFSGTPIGFATGIDEMAVNPLVNIPHGLARLGQDVYRRWSGNDPDAPDNPLVDWLHVPLSKNAQAVRSSIGDTLGSAARAVVSRIPKSAGAGTVVQPDEDDEATSFALDPLHGTPAGATEFTRRYGFPVGQDVGTVLGVVPGLKQATNFLRDVGESLAPEEVVARSSAKQSQGAASIPRDLSKVSPPLREAISKAGTTTNNTLHEPALDAQVRADQFQNPETGRHISLTEGEATNDVSGISRERNTPEMAEFYKNRADDLEGAYNEMARDASPSQIHTTQAQRGQTAVNAIEAYDAPKRAEISANYKALQDAHNGQTMPIDGPKLVSNIDHDMEEGLFDQSVMPSSWTKIRDKLANGGEISFQQFENLRTRLAETMRDGTATQKAAAGKVRQRLEEIPLTGEAKDLKVLADKARASAKARFDEIDADPAYKAVVQGPDVEPGKLSPLADDFLDKYLVRGRQANVENLMTKIGEDPDFKEALHAHVLDRLKKSATGKGANMQPGGFNQALTDPKILGGGKIEQLVRDPELRRKISDFNDTLSRAKRLPEGNIVSKSGTAQALADMAKTGGEHYLTIKSSGVYPVAKKVAERTGILPEKGAKFVKRVTRPGAGIDYKP